MPTDKHRIAAYLPKEVDEKFKAFKKEREVGDSQALILILGEFLEVSREVTHSGDSSLVEKMETLSRELEDLRLNATNSELYTSNLLSELKSELLQKIEEKDLEKKYELNEIKNILKSELLNELKSELLAQPTKNHSPRITRDTKEPRSNKSKISDSSKKSRNVNSSNGEDILTTTQLAERFQCGSSLISKQKGRYKDEPGKFVNWSKGKDPDGFGWEFREESSLLYRVKPLA